jgi:trigger factor
VQKHFAENAVAAAQLRAPLFEEKVVDFLLGKATITDRVVTRAELEAAIESEDETPLGATAHAHGEPGHVHGPDCDHGHDDAPAAAPKKKPAAKKAAKPAAEAAEAGAEAAPAPAKKPRAKKASAE